LTHSFLRYETFFYIVGAGFHAYLCRYRRKSFDEVATFKMFQMMTYVDDNYDEIRDAVRRLCSRFGGEYCREMDRERRYPSDFVSALTDSGSLSVEDRT
jgi:hypothetical protein|tara:strand:- start:11615 stop:11911 length:297 start_codon:yes stop_codon:yes gene_type:complete